MEEIFSTIRSRLDSADKAREEIFKLNRIVVRLASETIKSLHIGKIKESEKNLKLMNDLLDQINSLIRSTESSETIGTAMTAFQEYVEAQLLYDVEINRPYTTLEKLPDVPLIAYLGGFCDLIGELRRRVLDKLRNGLLSDAEDSFQRMEEILGYLVALNYPNGLIPGIRRKTDVGRAIVERTRGDLTLLLSHERLKSEIKRIKEIEKKVNSE